MAEAEKPSAPPAPAPAPSGTTTGTTTQIGTPSPAGGQSGSPPGGLEQLMFPMIAMGIFFWLFILRPENKRRKQKEALLSSVKVKDKVVTIFGLYGTVVEIDGEDIVLNVDTKKDVKMRFRRSAIDSVVTEEEKK